MAPVTPSETADVTDVPSARHAVWIPPFDELSDPRTVVALAVEAEAHGWDGFFLWDHVRWRDPIEELADPTVLLAAVAQATEALRIGPMVTPIARRRPGKLAREIATLDGLSGGRLVLGVGIGGDRFGGEFSRFGDEVDDRVRAEMTDEALAILAAAATGEPVHHRGAHYVVDDVTFRPRPVQTPGVPVWIAGFPGNERPMRRAARHDGFFPVNLSGPDALAEATAAVLARRAPDAGPFDIAVEVVPGVDPAPYVAAGATWCLTGFEAPASLDAVRGVVRDGPPRPNRMAR